jgi:hypothetical protein
MDLEKYLFNLILEFLLYEKLRKEKEVNLYIWNNDVNFKIYNNNGLSISINWISTYTRFEKNNYSDFCLTVSDQLQYVIDIYLVETEKETKRTNKEILEEWM